MASRITITDETDLQLKELPDQERRMVETVILARLLNQPTTPTKATEWLWLWYPTTPAIGSLITVKPTDRSGVAQPQPPADVTSPSRSHLGGFFRPHSHFRAAQSNLSLFFETILEIRAEGRFRIGGGTFTLGNKPSAPDVLS